MRTLAVGAAIVITVLGTGALASCTSSAPKTAAVLTGPNWRWSLLTTTSPAAQSEIDDPARYTLTFEPGHVVVIKADCQSGTGTYTTKGSAMTISAGALSKTSCPTDADASTFVGKLADVESYLLVDGRLALELKNDAGELRFTNGAAPATTLGS